MPPLQNIKYLSIILGIIIYSKLVFCTCSSIFWDYLLDFKERLVVLLFVYDNLMSTHTATIYERSSLDEYFFHELIQYLRKGFIMLLCILSRLGLISSFKVKAQS